MKIPFSKLPLGSHFKYVDGSRVYVVIEQNSRGVIASVIPPGAPERQEFFCFTDDEHTLDTEVIYISHDAEEIARLAREDMREQCAKVCEDPVWGLNSRLATPAQAIRNLEV